MTDTTGAPASAADRFSVPAIVTYVTLLIYAVVSMTLVGLIGAHVTVEPALLTLIGQIQGGSQTIAVAAVGYWVGASRDGKAANAALAQLAGAGAPPPADPVTQEKAS